MTDGGKIIRVTVDEISIMGRRTQGVRVFSVDESETVVSVTRLSEDGEDEEVGEAEVGAADISESGGGDSSGDADGA